MKKVLLCIGLLVSLSHSFDFEKWYVNYKINAKVKTVKEYELRKKNPRILKNIFEYDTLGRLTKIIHFQRKSPINAQKFIYKNNYLNEIEFGTISKEGKYKFQQKEISFRDKEGQIDSIQHIDMGLMGKLRTQTRLVYHISPVLDSIVLRSKLNIDRNVFLPINHYQLIKRDSSGYLQSTQLCMVKKGCKDEREWDNQGRYLIIRPIKETGRKRQLFRTFDKNDNLIEEGVLKGKRQGWYRVFELEYYN